MSSEGKLFTLNNNYFKNISYGQDKNQNTRIEGYCHEILRCYLLALGVMLALALGGSYSVTEKDMVIGLGIIITP